MSEKREALIVRRTIVETVAAAFVPAERSAEDAMSHGANCISVLIQQRTAAMLPPHAGAEALNLIAVGTQLAAEAHLQFAAAHRLLRRIPGEFGMPMALGPYCPDEAMATGALHLVSDDD